MTRQQGLATIWVVLIVIVLAGLAGTAVYVIRENLSQRKMVEKELQEAIEQRAEELAEQAKEAKEGTVDQESQQTIIQLISQFETFQQGSLASRVLALMTDPETSQERSDYNGLLVIPDDESAGYRLYSANDLSYEVKSHTVGEISNQATDQYQAKVIEVRDSNWSQATGGWTIKNREYEVIFEIVKEGESWSVDKYQAPGKTGKYSGFYISNF